MSPNNLLETIAILWIVGFANQITRAPFHLRFSGFSAFCYHEPTKDCLRKIILFLLHFEQSQLAPLRLFLHAVECCPGWCCAERFLQLQNRQNNSFKMHQLHKFFRPQLCSWVFSKLWSWTLTASSSQFRLGGNAPRARNAGRGVQSGDGGIMELPYCSWHHWSCSHRLCYGFAGL